MLSAMSDVAILGARSLHRELICDLLWCPGAAGANFDRTGCFLAACLYLWPLRDFVTFNADEGIILSDADRILRGQVPYRDFFSLYTPGSYFLLALAFKLFGQSLVVARSILLVYCGVFSSLSYLLARRISSRTASLFATALLTLGCLPTRFFVLHNWDSTLFALLTLYSASRFMETESRFWAAAIGMTAALTCLTEQARGAGLLLGLAIAGVVMLPRWRVRRIRSGDVFGCGMRASSFHSSLRLPISLHNTRLWPCCAPGCGHCMGITAVIT